MPRRRRLPSPSIFPRPPPKSIIVQFGPVKGQNSSTAPDERVDPPAIRRRCALLLSSRSSQLSCRCLSSRLHRPSRYYLKGGVRSQSPSRALGQRRIFSFISWALRIPLGISLLDVLALPLSHYTCSGLVVKPIYLAKVYNPSCNWLVTSRRALPSPYWVSIRVALP
jgi:hypothetical protein